MIMFSKPNIIPILDPKFDSVFKIVFATNENKNITIKLLNEVYKDSLASPIKDVTFIKNELDNLARIQRVSIVDVLCQSEDGTYFIVEMQRGYDGHFIKRSTLYAAKLYSSQLIKKTDGGETGVSYEDIKQVKLLTITSYILYPQLPDYYNHLVLKDKQCNIVANEEISYAVIELPKFTKEYNECVTAIDRLTYFLKHVSNITEDIIHDIKDTHDITRDVYMALDKVAGDPVKMASLEYELLKEASNKAEEARQKKIEEQNKKMEEECDKLCKENVKLGQENVKLGEENTKLKESQYNMIKNMLSRGMTKEEIAEIMCIDVSALDEYIKDM